MAEAQWHPKREAKRFEPPPWEREQFESLRKTRDEQAETEPPAVEARQEPEPASAEEGTEGAAAALAAELAAVRQEAEEHDAEPEAPAPKQAQRRAPAVPDAHVDAMLIQLGAEEPKVDEHLKVVGVFGSAVAMFFGVCMLFWGLFALMTTRGSFAGVVGALIVLGMGAVFGGLGLWFGWRVTNRGE
jgi:hypothetical protein